MQVPIGKAPPLPNPLLQRRRGRSTITQFFHSFSVTGRGGQSSLFPPTQTRKKCSTDPDAPSSLTDYERRNLPARGQSSFFPPTQTRKKCSTDPDAPPSLTGYERRNLHLASFDIFPTLSPMTLSFK